MTPWCTCGDVENGPWPFVRFVGMCEVHEAGDARAVYNAHRGIQGERMEAKDQKIAEASVSTWMARRRLLEDALERPATGIRTPVMCDVLGTSRLLHPVDFEGVRVGFGVSKDHAREILISQEAQKMVADAFVESEQARGRA